MKRIICLLIALIGTQLSASESRLVEWGDIHWGDYFKLDQQITLDSGDIFPVGHEFKFMSEVGLPILNVIVIEFEDLSCRDLSIEDIEPTLVLPKESDGEGDRRVFVSRAKDCLFDVYVEAKDYYSISFLWPSRN